MTTPFASGKWALGECDRCGEHWKLHELAPETVNGVRQDNRVCPKCWDEDNPLFLINKIDPSDPQALDTPRPQLGLGEQRELEDMALFYQYFSGTFGIRGQP